MRIPIRLNEHCSLLAQDLWPATYSRNPNPDLCGPKRKTGQNDGAREDRSSAVSETVDAGICKS